jgi:hypothetical protein
MLANITMPKQVRFIFLFLSFFVAIRQVVVRCQPRDVFVRARFRRQSRRLRRRPSRHGVAGPDPQTLVRQDRNRNQRDQTGR